jgi:hypothetical protein
VLREHATRSGDISLKHRDYGHIGHTYAGEYEDVRNAEWCVHSCIKHELLLLLLLPQADALLHAQARLLLLLLQEYHTRTAAAAAAG